MKKISRLSLSIMIIFFMFGCSQTPEEAFKETEKLNTISGYEKFLKNYSDSKFAQQAEINLEKLRWKDAQAVNTISGYEDFMNRYPNSQYVIQAQNSIEKLKWIGKRIFFKNRITIQGSSDNWLVNMMASDMMKSKYIVTYEALVEDVIGDSLKVIINGGRVDMLTTNGRTSVAQHENFAQAKSMASQMIGKTHVIEKSEVKILE
jgi:hypothetical protein